MTPISSNTGKIIPAKIPIFRLSPKAPDTIPTNVGPPEPVSYTHLDVYKRQPYSQPGATNTGASLIVSISAPNTVTIAPVRDLSPFPPVSYTHLLALLSMFWVRPDKAYFTYIDFRTLGLLFCLMAIVAGLKAVGVFDIDVYKRQVLTTPIETFP